MEPYITYIAICLCICVAIFVSILLNRYLGGGIPQNTYCAECHRAIEPGHAHTVVVADEKFDCELDQRHLLPCRSIGWEMTEQNFCPEHAPRYDLVKKSGHNRSRNIAYFIRHEAETKPTWDEQVWP